MRQRVIDFLVYAIVRTMICVVQAIRLETAARWAGRLAWLLGNVLKVRGKVVDENLRHAFPEMSATRRRELAVRMWEHLLLLAVEVAHAPRKIHETNWRRYVKLVNHDRIIRQILDSRPTIMLSGHFGNFEAGGFLLGLLGFPTFTVARTLDNAYLDRFVNRFRGATGQYIIPKNGGYDQILDVLASGGTMLFLADQYAGPKGCWVDFFNRPASAHKAIALLAMEHDAPVMIAYARRLDRPLHFKLNNFSMIDPRDTSDEVSSIQELTQWYTHRLEEFITKYPGQYWWLHRRWKDTRRQRKPKAKAA